MLTHVRAAAAPRRAPHRLPLQPTERGDDLLDSLGAVEDEEHILVLGNDGPDLMCALLRAGARQVTHVRSHERLEVWKPIASAWCSCRKFAHSSGWRACCRQFAAR